jgi:predicted ATPase
LYNRLDPVRRADLHEAMGKALETLYGEQAGELAVPLARHFEAAGMTDKAVEYLLQAGNRAARLFANEEAIAHYRRGIELLGSLPGTPQRARLELALQLAMGVPLIATRSFSDVETAAAYRRAIELARGVDALPELFQAVVGLKSYHDVHGDLPEASRLSEEMLQVARRLNDPGLTAIAHHGLSTTLLYLGRAHDFVEQRERMLALYDLERDRALVYQVGLDSQVASLSHAGWAYWFLGYPDQARQRSEEAVTLATESGHPFLLTFALMFGAFSSVYRREVRAARANAEQTIAVAGEHGHPLGSGGGTAVFGWVLGQQGHVDDAIAQILKGLAITRSTGAQLGYLQELSLLAETYCKAGRISEGLDVVDEALALIRATECRMDEPGIHRLKGELLLMQGAPHSEAEACFRRALDVARLQQARSWELRAAMSLGRLWEKQGRAAEARQLLEPIYGWFTEGFDTPDLQEAKALLEELA